MKRCSCWRPGAAPLLLRPLRVTPPVTLINEPPVPEGPSRGDSADQYALKAGASSGPIAAAVGLWGD